MSWPSTPNASNDTQRLHSSRHVAPDDCYSGHGAWCSYNDTLSDLLEKDWKKMKNKALLKIAGVAYQVDFERMVQVNCDTKYRRLAVNILLEALVGASFSQKMPKSGSGNSAKEQDKQQIDAMKPIEELAKQYKTDIKKGLSSKKAAEILERDGLNELEKPPKPTLLLLFLMQLTSFIIVLLMVSAIASVLVNATGPNAEDPLSYTTGIAIGLIVLLNAGIAAWTESKAGDALEALSKMTQANIYVLRDGKEVQVPVPTVVAGDIVVLGTGDVVPADLRLFEAKDFKVSEMALTGEPDDVAKTSKVKESDHSPADSTGVIITS
eukprot:g29361.t1